MNCLNTFALTMNSQLLFGGGSVRTWGTGNDISWAVFNNNVSTFLVEGFKNINLYSIEMVGFVQTDVSNTSGTSCSVEDYGLLLSLEGQFPRISGQMSSTNFWGIQPFANTNLSLTKYRSKLTFESPINSLTQVSITALFAQGTNAESSGLVNLRYNLTLLLNYTYEGEDLLY